jgi:hypothetical protein
MRASISLEAAAPDLAIVEAALAVFFLIVVAFFFAGMRSGFIRSAPEPLRAS